MSNSDDLAALQKSDQSIWIVYDGDCPFCSAYVKLVRLREIYSNVNLINAREGGAIVDEIKKIPLDLDDGMVLKMGNNFFHGNECMHILAS
ncbi:DCC1-like thiol-disulfide oxidoreductase family protein, partial [Ekhidna sp.]